MTTHCSTQLPKRPMAGSVDAAAPVRGSLNLLPASLFGYQDICTERPVT